MLTTLIKLRTEPNVATPALPRTQYRINSIDLLRGLVMIIMALDHVRDFTHREAMIDDPLNFATTTPLLFFTRWITHFCAPVFVFLAGTSGFLQSLRKSTKELSLFLIKRGLWLVLLEVTLITFAITFDVHWGILGLQTIWAIGISMVFLGLAVWLPFKAILALGLLIVLGHNSLDFYEAGHKGGYSVFYSLLHRQGFFPLWDNHGLLILYPFLSWTGLMLLGYCFGKIFTLYEGVQRRKVLTAIGLGVIAFFIALRATNTYGDPSHWSTQKNSLFTVLSFINTTKYPPSLLYMCMTIGPAILFLAWMNNFKNGLSRIITVYGRVPFFYYVLHFYLIHAVALVLSLLRGHSFAAGAAGAPNIPFKFVFPGEGVSLGVTYLIWLGVVVVLYPLCKRFSDYKQTHRQWWLSYL
ncbi:DUF1624 domain-containing protein [Flavisolibacter nicotianae]|uniref:DUF1624 domain-containing protein n=1 Tax=Flavisolibacter nicotianae TaxID=2364882 RepID=UPI000EB5AB3A|nr:heparan-alpha-glucosaminide N-acetyltransferase domain-containing protein [Flavisolibacter nicotianae]